MPNVRLFDGRDYADLNVRARCGYDEDFRTLSVADHVDAILEAYADEDQTPDADEVKGQAEQAYSPPCRRSWVVGQACLTCPWADLEVIGFDSPDDRIGFR